MEHQDLSTSCVGTVVDDYFAEHWPVIEARLRSGLEDVQLRLLEGLFRTVQAGHLRRIAALEANAARDRQTLTEISQSTGHMDDDLRRLARGIQTLIAQPERPIRKS